MADTLLSDQWQSVIVHRSKTITTELRKREMPSPLYFDCNPSLLSRSPREFPYNAVGCHSTIGILEVS